MSALVITISLLSFERFPLKCDSSRRCSTSRTRGGFFFGWYQESPIWVWYLTCFGIAQSISFCTVHCHPTRTNATKIHTTNFFFCVGEQFMATVRSTTVSLVFTLVSLGKSSSHSVGLFLNLYLITSKSS